jgi:hypothetical protein
MFEMFKKSVLSFLKAKSFAKIEGKEVLTEDQQDQIKAEYGDKFLEKFMQDLEKDQEDGNKTDPTMERFSKQLMELKTQNDQILTKNGELETEVTTLKGQVEKLSEEPETEPKMEIVEENGKKVRKIKPNLKLSHNALAHSVLVGGDTAPMVTAGDTINVDDVITEFGDLVDYYKPEVIKDIMYGFTTSQYLTWKREIHSYKATQALITSVVQQFTPKWTPLGQTKFTPLEIPLRRMKINLPITPAEVEDWIYMMYDESKDLDQHPITLYILNNLLAPKAMDDIELRMIATGVYEELDWSTVSDEDTGQAPAKSMDGFLTILKQQKANVNTKVNFIDLGTITDENNVDKMNLFVDSIDEYYQTKNMPVFCSLTRYKQYKRAYKKLYGSDSGDPQFGGDVIDYSKNRLVPLDCMSGSDVLFTTPKENFIGLRHKNEPGTTKIFTQKHNYTLKVFGEFRLGVGFAIAEAVFAYYPDADGSGSGSAA